MPFRASRPAPAGRARATTPTSDPPTVARRSSGGRTRREYSGAYVAVGAYTDEFFAKITSVNDWGSTEQSQVLRLRGGL